MSKSTLEQFRISRISIPNQIDGLPVVYSHGNFINAAQFFQEAGCQQQLINLIFSKNGSFNRDLVEDDKNLYSHTLRKTNEQLRRNLGYIYSTANPLLDYLFETGFNKHDITHISHVVQNTDKLLSDGGYSQKVRRRGAIAAWCHDLGNPFGREPHSLTSARITKLLLPGLPEDKKQWRVIRRAVQLHNEPIASALINSFHIDDGRLMSEEEVVSLMGARFGPEALALIIADKTDIGRHRISDKPNNWDAIDNDPHLEVNLLLKTDQIQLSEDGSEFSWKLVFTPGMSDEEEESIKERFGKDSTGTYLKRARVSAKTHELHRKYNIPHFDTCKKLFWTLYYDRIYLTIRAAFALYPQMKSFVLSIEDDADGATDSMTFTREDLAEKMMIRKVKYISKDKRKRD